MEETYIKNLTKENAFIGYNPHLISGLVRAQQMINDDSFKNNNNINPLSIIRNSENDAISINDQPIYLNFIDQKGCKRDYIHGKYQSMNFTPLSILYSDGAIETMGHFKQDSPYDIRNKKDSKIFYDCHLWVPIGGGKSSLKINYLHPVKKGKLLSELIDWIQNEK